MAATQRKVLVFLFRLLVFGSDFWFGLNTHTHIDVKATFLFVVALYNVNSRRCQVGNVGICYQKL